MNYINTKNTVCVLFSGGIDSTACISFYKMNNYNVQGLYIDYGQPSAKRELQAVKKLSNLLDVNVKTLSLRPNKINNDELIIGRNAFLLTTALLIFPIHVSIVAMGVHAGTDYNDCNIEFINSMQQIFDTYTFGKIQIYAPFIEWSKADIWKYCKKNNIPTGDTYSCELGLIQPCGQCLSCNDLRKLYAL